jgi:hypothetical protein
LAAASTSASRLPADIGRRRRARADLLVWTLLLALLLALLPAAALGSAACPVAPPSVAAGAAHHHDGATLAKSQPTLACTFVAGCPALASLAGTPVAWHPERHARMLRHRPRPTRIARFASIRPPVPPPRSPFASPIPT